MKIIIKKTPSGSQGSKSLDFKKEKKKREVTDLTKRKDLDAHIYLTKIGDKIVEILYSSGVTSGNKTIQTPPASPPFEFGVFVVFYRYFEQRHNIA